METLSLYLNQTCLWIFAGLLLYAAWSDFREFLIPNKITIGILSLYPAFVLTSPQAIDWQYAGLIAGGVLLFGLIFFATNRLGGGDVKLLAVCALWAGPDLALPFIFLTAIVGGVLSIALLIRLNYGWVIGYPPSSNASRNVPYGLAISTSGLFVAAQLMIALGQV